MSTDFQHFCDKKYIFSTTTNLKEYLFKNTWKPTNRGLHRDFCRPFGVEPQLKHCHHSNALCSHENEDTDEVWSGFLSVPVEVPEKEEACAPLA